MTTSSHLPTPAHTTTPLALPSSLLPSLHHYTVWPLDGDVFSLGSLQIETLFTPCHTKVLILGYTSAPASPVPST